MHGEMRSAVRGGIAMVAALLLLVVAVGTVATNRGHPGPAIELSAQARRARAEAAPDRTSPRASASAPHPPSAALLAPAAGQQPLVVSVEVPSGPLLLSGAPSSITLERQTGTNTFHGTVHGVLVVDTRGTNAGWRLLVTPGAIGSGTARVFLGVTKVVATAASTAGLAAQGHVATSSGRPVPLVVADPVVGNGAFEVSFEIDAWIPDSKADRVELGLGVSVV